MNTTRYFLLSIFVLSLVLPVFAEAADAKRPNILFIITDDQSPLELQCYNPNSPLKTPVLNKIAAEGMVFDRAYHQGSWSGAVCRPSRHMVMCGRTVWHIPGAKGFVPKKMEILDGAEPVDAKKMNKEAKAKAKAKGKTKRNKKQALPNPLVPADLANYTMAAVFNRAGYATMRTCKNGNSYEAANQLFTVRKDKGCRGNDEDSGSRWHAQQVLDYLDERAKSKEKKPFLIYYGFSHPHDARKGREFLLEKYGAINDYKPGGENKPTNDKTPKLPPNWLTAHPFNNSHMNVRDEVSVNGVGRHRDEVTIRNEIGRYMACCENIDIQIGRVLEKLKEMGELDNTYIFFTSDHGIAIGRHGLQGKQNLYEHTWRVPFVVKGPGVKKGRVEGNVYLLDVLPTLCDLAGIEQPKTVEGESLKPVLEGKKEEVRDILYGVYCGGAKPGMRAVRKGDWKLIKYETAGDEKSKVTQLFNLAENPNEFIKQHQDAEIVKGTGVTPTKSQTNLADNPKYAAKRKEMEALLLEQMKKHDDPHRFWDQPARE